MYSWGGDTSMYRGPGEYKYDSARAPYLDKLDKAGKDRGPRTYSSSRSPDMDLVDPRGKKISSDSENPIVFAVDVTGSMASWPGEIFDRVPLLYQTLSQYRADAEFCFAAIGDAYCDRWPLQVNDFAKEISLEDKIKAIGCEGSGGGQQKETYELFGHYMLNHCSLPNATNPFLFICGDEGFYPEIDNRQVTHYIGDNLEGTHNSMDMWKKLSQKFNIFLLHKPYGGSVDETVVNQWGQALGSEKIIELPSKERVVDIAMGIVAKQWGEYGDFSDNLSARQDKANQESVHKSLRHLSTPAGGASVTRESGLTTSLSKLFDEAKG